MREKPDMPLTPVELFRRGIEITREIRGRIIETRAYYLGRSSREPAQPLSEVFDPTRGPILKYFVQTVRTINRTRFIERFCRTAAFREFRQASEATLEELRLLAIQLAMCLGVPDKTDRRRSVGQALKTSVYFFRIANGRFFRQLPWNGSLVHLLLKNRNNEGFGIYIANRLLNDIAKAFEARERQLRGETAAPAHEFFTSQFERIERKIESEHNRTRQRIEETERRIESWKDGFLVLLNPVVSFIKWVMPRFKTRERGGEITQEQVARDFGVSRSTVNRWEVNQTASGPENKSNKYGYYKELRTNPDLRGAYYELVNCVKRYQAEKRKADKLGIRFATFVRFHEEWLTHQPDKMRHLRMG